MPRLPADHPQPGRWPAPALVLAVIVACGSLSGCSRAFWREHADRNHYDLVRQKLFDPRWQVERIGLTPHPLSRMHDPYDPDCGPLPPDDPAAHRYMHHVAWFRAWRGWHKFGRALSIENPHWLEPFGLEPTADAAGPAGGPAAGDDRGVLPAGHEQPADGPDFPDGDASDRDTDGAVQTANGDPPLEGRFGIRNLTLTQALELSYLHSREYQSAIEDVYLTALDLSFERYQFNLRFLGFGGSEPTIDAEFRSTPDGPNDLEVSSRFGVSQLLPTGGQLIVELANNTLWMFTGPNRQASASVLSYSLVQPLLRNAGRKIALENLTQTERNLLYAVRDLARFRELFFVRTVGGAGASSGGVLGLIQQLQAIANSEDNIRRLEFQSEFLQALASQRPDEALEPLPALGIAVPLPTLTGPLLLQVPPPLLGDPQDWPALVRGQLSYDLGRQALVWRGTMTDEQEAALLALSRDLFYGEAMNELVQKVRGEVLTQPVLQLRSRLLSQRQRLSNQRAQYQESLDQFKIELGLPPDFQVSLDRSLLDPFELIDPGLLAAERELYDFLQLPDWVAINADDPDIDRLRSLAAVMGRLEERVSTDSLGLVERDLESVRASLPERLSRLATDADRELVEGTIARDERLYRSLRRGLRENVAVPLDELRALVVAEEALSLEQRQRAFEAVASLREALLAVVQGLQALQIGLRTELITLNEFEIPREEAVALALHNRVDLMNVRAQVMDARRRIEIAANQLEAVLNVRAEGDLRTPPLGSGNNRPFNFRGDQSEFRVGVQFTAPLDRIDERNDYRAALIDYQQARRSYMEFEDNVKFQVRAAHRNLLVLRENFELARQAVRIAALQLDSAVEETLAPARAADPIVGGGAGSSAFNLLDALNNVLNAQDALIRTWVDYERNRLNIYRDMGIMIVDERGVWVDAFYQRQAPGTRSPANTEPTPQIHPAGPQEDDRPRTGGLPQATPQGNDHEAHREQSPTGDPAGHVRAAGRVAELAHFVAQTGPHGAGRAARGGQADAALDAVGGNHGGPRACRPVRGQTEVCGPGP
ncbi:MAG TPA: TolC family protein [Planctomycetaceae bacterium]|nr:TolC family protein [Planctomycetaceae bacterium]